MHYQVALVLFSGDGRGSRLEKISVHSFNKLLLSIFYVTGNQLGRADDQ